MSFDVSTVGLIVLFLWLCMLTFFLGKIHAMNNRIFEGAKDASVSAILQKLFFENKESQKTLTSLEQRLDMLEKQSPTYFQKIGLIRFNPFKDTGGDQSFILALTDAQHSGIVISGLYSRSGSRWYAKRIEHGKGVDHELSDEEKRAIAAAK